MPSFFFNDTATTEIYPLSLPTLFRSVPHPPRRVLGGAAGRRPGDPRGGAGDVRRSEEHTSELQSHFHLLCRLFFLMIRRPPRSTLFPSRRSSDLFHIRHGEYWVERLAADPATHEEAQATFGKWYVRTLNIFGRPGSQKNQVYRALRLKLRDNDEVRQAFRAEVQGLCKKFGLEVPPWRPVWSELPEEAQIPG